MSVSDMTDIMVLCKLGDGVTESREGTFKNVECENVNMRKLATYKA